jgi:hypothetical protein
MAGAAALIYTFMSVYFRIQNKKRKDGEQDHLIEGLSEEEIAEKGDENPRYMYTV